MWALLVGFAASAMSCGEEVGPEMQTLLSDPMASYDTADAELVKRSVFPPREISGKPADGFVSSRFVVGPGADPLAVRDAAVDAAERHGWEFFTDEDADTPSAYKTIDGVDASLSLLLHEEHEDVNLSVVLHLK